MATRVDHVQEPKHTVFLSHSGAQKDFVDQLCVDLERVSYVPFFDRNHESLEKGAPFADLIFKAIRNCSLLVLVLSEQFFTKTKWPMMELAAAVEAQSENPNLKLLPLFFKITPSEFKAEKRRAHWFQCWIAWETKTSRIDIAKWKDALKVVERCTGITYNKDRGDVEYRKQIVEDVCRIRPNNVFDVSHVVGRERICEIVAHKFDKLKCKVKVPQLGVFGMGGLGKTTLCKIMCNHYFADFGGNVIHINLTLNTLLEHQKKVIGKLIGATPTITDLDEGHVQLKRILSMHKVFLALDNVIDDVKILEEAKKYLSFIYGVGSMILVTSRSLLVLLSELGITENHCLEVPDLNKTEAISLFLQASPPNKHVEFSSYSEDEQKRIEEGVGNALFARTLREGEIFHPLALMSLGSTLVELINKPKQWRRILIDLNWKFTEDKDHRIFSILGSSFKMLPVEQILIFMDVALFKPSCAIVKKDVLKWLRLVHGLSYVQIERHLASLRKKSLLEEGVGEEETKPMNIDEGSTTPIETSRLEDLEEMDVCSSIQVVVHDLYVEFAKWESNKDSLDNIQCFAHENFKDFPSQMQGFPSSGTCWALKRFALIRGRFRGQSDLSFCDNYKNVKVLKLEYLRALIHLDIECMVCLTSVDIFYCDELCNIRGLQMLKMLAWLRVARCKMLEDLPNLQNLCSLEHVEIRNTRKILKPIISNCGRLYELRLSDHDGVQDLSNIQALHALRKVMIEWCPKLRTFPMLKDCRLLRELYVVDCSELRGVMDIGSLVAMKKLHLRNINICELRGVGLMTNLCELVCEQCPEFGGLLEVGRLLALQKLHLTDIAIEELNGIGQLTCLCKFVWKLSPKLGCKFPNGSGLTDLAEFTKLSKFTNLVKLDIVVHDSKSFTLQDVLPLRSIRVFLQDQVHCDIGDLNHVMDIVTQHAVIAVERQFWSFMMVPSAYDADLEEIGLDNDNFGTSQMIPQVIGRHVKLQTTLRFFYGDGLKHVNEHARRMGSCKRIVSCVESMFQGLKGPGMSTLGFRNINVLYLDNLEIGHLQLIGMKCLSKLYIRRCKRLLRPVILEDMVVLEEVKMVDCEYLDDDCVGMRIRKCVQLRKVTIIACKKLRPIFVCKAGKHLGFQNLVIEDMSAVQISTNATWKNIVWYQNMHGKVNIECCDNMLNDYSYGSKFGLLLFKMYVAGVVPALATGVMNMMTQYVDCRVITNDSEQLCCWTLIVLQSSSIVPDDDFMSNFDAILGRSSILNIALEFARQEFKTKLCFFSGVLCEEVLKNLPSDWSPIRIVSFTGDKFRILNQENMSKRLGNITTLHLNDIEFDKLDLHGLECVKRLELQNVRNLTSEPIILKDMATLQYVKLVDLEYGMYYSRALSIDNCPTLSIDNCPALSINNCPLLHKVVLDKCTNALFVFDNKFMDFPLKKLFIKDCPHLLRIGGIFFSLQKEQWINCPKWRTYDGVYWMKLAKENAVIAMEKAEMAVIATGTVMNATNEVIANARNATNEMIMIAALKAANAAVNAANAAVKAANAVKKVAIKVTEAKLVEVGKVLKMAKAVMEELPAMVAKLEIVVSAVIMAAKAAMAVANEAIMANEAMVENKVMVVNQVTAILWKKEITTILSNELIASIVANATKKVIAASAAIIEVKAAVDEAIVANEANMTSVVNVAN